ncbi:MAG: hypothetical protein JF627_04335 [Alphaproteobacteria bacterium]|nr:hypothetical protein [Alphaproteobacteria bacterium]
MARSFGQPAPLEKAGRPKPAAFVAPAAPIPKLRPSRFGLVALLGGIFLSLFWIGVSSAFIWGLLGPQGLLHLTLAAKSAFVAGVALPPLLFLSIAAALARSAAMTDATRVLLASSERLFAADETAANNAARLARAVRRELDGLNTGLDVAFQRMRTMEAVLEKQISTLDDAGARAAVRADTIAGRLNQESARIESLGDTLNEAAGRAGESMAGRTAQLKAMMESAEGTLKMATQSLDVQAAGFRSAITAASEAPLEAAKSLEAQAARIEQVSDAAMGRAEFVLARHEKHRTQMGELVQRLKEESEVFEAALSTQRTGMENAIQALTSESHKFEMVTGDAERHLELIMANAASRAAQLTSAFAREAERLKETGEAATAVLATLSAALKDAGTGAQTLIGESADQAKHDARLLVGEAMAECERLLRASGEMSAEAGKIRNLLAETTKEVEKHLIRLPGLAAEEARRVRQMMASETEQILDLSARTMSTLHARSTAKVTPPDLGGPMKPVVETEADGLKGLARKLTNRKSAEKSASGGKAWEMKTLLAAAEQEGEIRLPKSDKQGLEMAATLGALQLALADMAIDLSALDDAQPGDEDWKRYLAGDRAVFARRLADAIDDSAVDRITNLYRDDKRFHNAADAYLAEFENLLARAREGDGGGLLTSTLLSADTGKVYLTIAYALGRL